MEFYHGGMILPDAKVPIGKGKAEDPSEFTVPAKGGAAIVGVRDWNEKNAQTCINAGIALMNMKADDVVTPVEMVSLVDNLFPSYNLSKLHLKELTTALEQLQSAKADKQITVMEGFGLVGTLLPAIIDMGGLGAGKSMSGVTTKITDFIGGIFGGKKK